MPSFEAPIRRLLLGRCSITAPPRWHHVNCRSWWQVSRFLSGAALLCICLACRLRMCQSPTSIANIHRQYQVSVRPLEHQLLVMPRAQPGPRDQCLGASAARQWNPALTNQQHRSRHQCNGSYCDTGVQVPAIHPISGNKWPTAGPGRLEVSYYVHLVPGRARRVPLSSPTWLLGLLVIVHFLPSYCAGIRIHIARAAAAEPLISTASIIYGLPSHR